MLPQRLPIRAQRGVSLCLATLLALTLVGLTTVNPVAAAAGIGGTTFAWGPNGAGTLCLGSGATEPRYTSPQALPAATIPAPRQLATGSNFTLLLKDDGKVYACGNNGDYGQLGNGIGQDSGSHPALAQVVGLAGIAKIAAGTSHALALGQDGTVYSWGSNIYGELGLGGADTNPHPTPAAVPGLANIVAVAAGLNTSFAIGANGTVWAWGENSNSRLGTGVVGLQLKSPAAVLNLPAAAAVAAGDTYAVAVTQGGAVYAWGYNLQGQIGNGTADTLTYLPTPVAALGATGNSDVASGYRHILVLKANGTVWGWGQDNVGQVGGGSASTTGCVCRTTPIQVTNLAGVKAIGIGYAHGLALKTDGTVWAWGQNGGGQLGLGTNDGNVHPTPAQVVGLDLSSAAGYDGLLGRGPSGLHSVAARRYQTWHLSLATAGTGTGTAVAAPPPGDIEAGTNVILTATPGDGSAFTGWTINGTFVGWSRNRSLVLDGDLAIAATFVPAATFPDVGTGRADAAAIVALASRGTIRGYANGNYGPDDGVQRAQMAALIARAMPAGPGTPPTTLTPPACLAAGSWDCEEWGNAFTDRNGLDANLWRNVGALGHYNVARGYAGADCAARGLASPCFAPTAPVSYIETVTFVTRAMIAKGYWQLQPNAPQPHAGVPAVFAPEVATFHYYTQELGGVPAPPSNWNAGATRGWFARALWIALDSYWGAEPALTQ